MCSVPYLTILNICWCCLSGPSMKFTSILNEETPGWLPKLWVSRSHPHFSTPAFPKGKSPNLKKFKNSRYEKQKNISVLRAKRSLSSLRFFSLYNIISELKNTLFDWGYRTKKSIFFVHVFCIFVILKYSGTYFGKGDKRLSNFFLAPLGVPWRLFNPTVGKWPCSSQINPELYKSEYCKFFTKPNF